MWIVTVTDRQTDRWVDSVTIAMHLKMNNSLMCLLPCCVSRCSVQINPPSCWWQHSAGMQRLRSV